MADDIAALEEQRDAKFQEILEAVASELKLGKFDTLSPEDQDRVEEEAEEASERWMDEIESAPREPKTPLEKLLAEHYAIAMKIPEEDEEDEEDESDEKGHDRR
jgi:hypothetical protein